MNKSIIWVFLLGIVGLISGCMSGGSDLEQLYQANENTVIQYGKDKGLTLIKDPNSGVYYYKTVTNATGRGAAQTELVKMFYTYTKLDGTMLDSTTKTIPFGLSYLTYSTILNTPIALMKEGESGVFIFPQTSQLTEPTILTVKFASTRNETEQIDEFVKTKYAGLEVVKTSTGLQYVITKSTATGDLVKSGQTITVSYTGKLLYPTKKRDSNGFYIYNETFDSGSISFVLGQGSMVAGFEEAVSKLRLGDKGTFVFPSSLGYGQSGRTDSSTGAYTIPPYSPMNFEIEVTAVK